MSLHASCIFLHIIFCIFLHSIYFHICYYRMHMPAYVCIWSAYYDISVYVCIFQHIPFKSLHMLTYVIYLQMPGICLHTCTYVCLYNIYACICSSMMICLHMPCMCLACALHISAYVCNICLYNACDCISIHI